jgi:hypothetical protein
MTTCPVRLESPEFKHEIIRLYAEENLSPAQVSKLLRCSPQYVRLTLMRNGIPTRNHVEAGRFAWKQRPHPCVGKSPSVETRQKISTANSGMKNGHWKGGIWKSGYTYDFMASTPPGKELTLKLLARSGGKCELCGFDPEGKKKALHRHHIDADKKNDSMENLLVLCHSCHFRTERKEHPEKWHRHATCEAKS